MALLGKEVVPQGPSVVEVNIQEEASKVATMSLVKVAVQVPQHQLLQLSTIPVEETIIITTRMRM